MEDVYKELLVKKKHIQELMDSVIFSEEEDEVLENLTKAIQVIAECLCQADSLEVSEEEKDSQNYFNLRKEITTTASRTTQPCGGSR